MNKKNLGVYCMGLSESRVPEIQWFIMFIFPEIDAIWRIQSEAVTSTQSFLPLLTPVGLNDS